MDMDKAMTVHFIGAGPGAADLITVRGRDLIARCPVCLYAGSIVPRELLGFCPPGARIVDTAPLSLDEIEAEFAAAHAASHDVARLHSGDLSIFSALAEQPVSYTHLDVYKRQIWYNLTITAVSVLVAVLIGGIEALGLVADKLGLAGGFWNKIADLNDGLANFGYLVIGVFIGSWIVSYLIYRWQGFDRPAAERV